MSAKLPVRFGTTFLPEPMTKTAAKRLGDARMPGDLKRAGFKTVIYTAETEINGWSGYSINYGK